MRRLFLFLLVILAGSAFGQDAQSAEKVVRSFVEALNRGDLQGAAKFIKGGQVGDFLKSPSSQFKVPAMAISDVEVALVRDRALVSYDLKFKGTETSPGEHSEYLMLEKSGTDWLIDVPMRDGGLAFMTYLLSNPPMLAQAHKAAEATSCLSNVKQISLAFIMFITDFDDVFKLTAADWKQKISPYVKNASIFTCPDDLPGTLSYSFNGQLAGKNMESVDSPATTVLVYEGKYGVLSFRHNGRAAVGFLDGHAKLVSKEEAKNLVWKP